MKRVLLSALLMVVLMPSAKASVVSGNPDGKVTVVEYYDYNCPHCRTMSGVIDRIEHNKQVRVERRVVAMMSKDSMFAAKAILASRKQGVDKYQRFNLLLMAERKFIDSTVVMNDAEEAGLNIDLLAQHMENPAILAEIKSNMSAAHSQDIHMMPTTLVMPTGEPRSAQRFVGKVSIYKLNNAIADFL